MAKNPHPKRTLLDPQLAHQKRVRVQQVRERLPLALQRAGDAQTQDGSQTAANTPRSKETPTAQPFSAPPETPTQNQTAEAVIDESTGSVLSVTVTNQGQDVNTPYNPVVTFTGGLNYSEILIDAEVLSKQHFMLSI